MDIHISRVSNNEICRPLNLCLAYFLTSKPTHRCLLGLLHMEVFWFLRSKEASLVVISTPFGAMTSCLKRKPVKWIYCCNTDCLAQTDRLFAQVGEIFSRELMLWSLSKHAPPPVAELRLAQRNGPHAPARFYITKDGCTRGAGTAQTGSHGLWMWRNTLERRRC